MAINLLNNISSTGSLTITKPTTDPLLTIHNTTNGGGVAIRFIDTSGGSQPGDLTYKHSDSQSQGGGASWHFVAENQTHVVVGDGSKIGRVIVKSGGNVAKADYAFFDDINTGMLRTSADNVSLVAGGVANVGVGSTAVSLKYAGTTKLTTLNTGIQVAGDGTFSGSITTTSASGIKIDTTGNALLQLDGASGSTEAIIFKHSGTEVSRISHSNSTDLVFSTGSSVDTALTLSGLNATFAGRVMADTHFQSSDTNATLSATGNGNVYLRPNGYSTTTGQVHINTSGNATFAGPISTPTGSTFAGAIKITETGTSQHILIGNQDSGGVDKPAMIQGVNGQLNLGFGNSWSGEGGTMTDTLSLDTSNNATFAGNIIAGGAVYPASNASASLGLSNKQWAGLDLSSSSAITWGNGDAEIIEGETNNYSLTFKTYDGTSNSAALRLDGDNTATFTGLVSGITPTSNANFTTKGYVDTAVSGAGNVTTGGFTSGRIPFANSSVNLTNDADLAWDDTNKKLLIGQPTSQGASGTVVAIDGRMYIEDAGTNWNVTTPGKTQGSLHFDPQPPSTDNIGNAITFGASDTSSGTTAHAGIYTRSDGTYGTKMYIATTDDYSIGSKTAITILQNGSVKNVYCHNR